MSVFRHSNFTFKILSKAHGLLYVLNSRLNKKIPGEIHLRKYIIQSIGWVGGSIQEMGDEMSVNYKIEGEPFTIFLRKNSSDANVFVQCILNREYEIVASMGKSIPSRLRIIDGGANIGVATIHFNCALKGNCDIVCVEPLLENANHLQRVLEANDYQNVSVLRKGLWNTKAYLKPTSEYHSGMEWGFSLKATDIPDESCIEVTTVASIMKQKNWTGIDILKLDIEGGEAAIFNDSSCLDSFLPFTKIITIEVHENHIKKQSVREKLCNAGFVVFENSEHLIGVNLSQKESLKA